MALHPNPDPANKREIRDLLKRYRAAKERAAVAQAVADALKEQIDALLTDCEVAHVDGMELARVPSGQTRSWDTAGLLRFCDTLRRTDNADLADAILAFLRHGERQGYFRIAPLRERPLPNAPTAPDQL